MTAYGESTLEVGRRQARRDQEIMSAVARARGDREHLADLVRRGLVSRDPAIGRNVPGALAFRNAIESMVSRRRAADLAIRPSKKNKRNRRR